jgi:hypothetical protein
MLSEKGYNCLKGLKKGIPKFRCINQAREEISWGVGKDHMTL